VAGVGGGYKNTLMMARNAEQVGADAVLVFAYPLACGDADGEFQYLHDAATAVSTAVLVYPCGEDDIRISVLKRLAELPNVVGFKDSSGGVNVGQSLGSLIGSKLLWIAEGEPHAEIAFPAGARAFTTAVATFVPEACQKFWQSGTSGNLDQMKQVRQTHIDPIIKVRGLRPGYGISGIKVALETQGRAGGTVRPPGTQVMEEDRPKIAAITRKHAEQLQLKGS